MWFDSYERQRSRMVHEQLRARGIQDERVLEAMLRVPRHEFVPPQLRNKAYGDFPVPIPAEQTVSQPYIVAAMVQALQLNERDTVLEIGTGTGYQAAVLSLLSTFAYTVERHEVLAQIARENLGRLGYTNTEVISGDGTLGLPQHAPFQAIIVAAAAPTVPHALIEQLASGGRMIIPVGTRDTQVLQLIRKQDDQVFTTTLEGCRFVPLVGASGFEQAE